MSKVFSLASDLAGLSVARGNLTNPSANDLQTQVNRRLCDALATAPGEFASEWYLPAGLAQQFCVPYYEQNGDEGAAAAPPPFTGGQCETRYRVSYTYTRFVGSGCTPSVSTPSTQEFDGPLGAPFLETETGSGFRRYNWKIPTNGGTSVATLQSHFDGDPACPPTTIENFTVVRVDGGSDDCGNLPSGDLQPDPAYSNPVDPTQPVPVVYGPRNTNINLGFDVRQDVDGDEYINISGPSFELNVSSSGGEPSLPAQPDPPSTEGNPQEPAGASGEGDDDITTEEEEQGFETIGYRWQLLNIPSGYQRIPGTDPVVFPHVQGNLALKYENAGGLTFYSDAARILVQDGSVLRQDPSLKVKGYVYNHLPSIGGIRLTPIRARRLQDGS